MFENFRVFETEFAGRKMTFETGKMCCQASGSVLVRYGETTVLVNATASAKPRDGIDFLPLSVDFEEKLYTKKLCNYYKKEWFYPNFNFITVSNHTACSFKTYFPELRDEEVPVFYSPSTSPQIELKRVYAQRYFMLVSGNRVEKNNLRAIMALDKLFSVGYLLDFTVKIAGAKDASIYSYKIKNTCKFEFLGYVDDSLLEQLYHDAYCLVYPSLNEGFGYPPLEAMHYGVPVIASPFASIPEVCEDSALYFNPFSIEEIAARILRILDPGVHSIYSKKAYAQYQKITAIQNNDLDALIDYLYQNK